MRLHHEGFGEVPFLYFRRSSIGKLSPCDWSLLSIYKSTLVPTVNSVIEKIKRT